MKSDFIWMDGVLVPFADAKIHVLTPGLHYGMGVFEGIRCYNTEKGPAVFRMEEHMQRLRSSAHIFGIRDYPYSVEGLSKATADTIKANKFNECYIRPLIYMADGPLGLNLDASRPATSIAVWEWGALLGDTSKGIKLMVSSVNRMHVNSNPTKAKVSGNYVNSIMAKTIAVRAGFNEAVMLDTQGYVAECTGENLFVVRDGKIYTAGRANILEGITRDTLITLARQQGYEVVEEPMTRDQIYMADEVFLCGTAAEVVPVSEVDFRVIGDGERGPITTEIQQTYYDTVRGKSGKNEEWLYFI
ncbi:MAG: branched-chain amino acid transaminase [Anaerolineales bacterium]|nr:branched-chain amino acid transaminase [Anaerolineales bacterium]